MVKIAKAKWIVTAVRDRHTPILHEDAALAHEHGRVLEVGPAAEVIARHPDASVEGSDEHVILPGFVNAHHHVGVTPLQLGSPDTALELWFASRMAAKAVDPYCDTLYSAFEMIASGITTVQHLDGWRAGPIDHIRASGAEMLRAYRDIGMRVSYAHGVRDQNIFVHQDDDATLASLPPETRERMAAFLAPQRMPLADQLALYDDLAAAHRDDAMIRIQLAPANLHWCSDTALAEIDGRSRRGGVPMHMHLLETAYQKEYARRRFGTTAVAHLDRLGMLSERLTLGHGVWLTEDDADRIAAAGACICHNCSSNFRLRSGIAPLNAYAARGIRVAIGLDEAGINDDRDMLQEMRMVLRAHRVPGMDDVPPTCAEVLRMATLDGAMTTPFGDTIGRLEPGCHADFVVINHKRAFYPYQDDLIPLIDALVQRAKTTAVDATVIAGETIYRDGVFTTADRDEILGRIERQLATPRSAADEQLIPLSREMVQYVTQFYAGYFDPDRQVPFYHQSSRT